MVSTQRSVVGSLPLAMAANHPQLGAALSNIAELNRIYLEHQRESLRAADGVGADESRDKKRKKSKKAKRDKKGKDKGKGKSKGKRKRDKDDRDSKKKSKKRKKERKDVSSSSSSSDSSVGSGPSDDESSESKSQMKKLTPEEQLQRGRTAMECTKHILAKFPDVRNDFRNILKSIDDGEAVSVDGVPDVGLKKLLTTLFDALGLLRLSKKSNARSLPKDFPEKLLSKLAPVFDMTTEQLTPFRDKTSPSDCREDAKSDGDEKIKNRVANKTKPVTIGMTGEEAEAILADNNLEDTVPGIHGTVHANSSTVDETNARDGNLSKPSDAAAARPGDVKKPTDEIGPSTDPPAAPIGPSSAPPTKPPPRVLGPAMPPRAMLEAAAQELNDDVGPAPPEIVQEVALVGADARVAAAKRVLCVLQQKGDAYDVLGVVDVPKSTPATLKRLYWKLSLSVHPDKCEYSKASDAFDAVKKAHECLSDPVEKQKIDALREEAHAREGFDAWLASELQAAIWRKSRGEPAPGDDELLRGPDDPNDNIKGGREEWMTVLPEQRRPVQGGEVDQGGRGNVKSFSQKSFVERDQRTITDWTAAPKDQQEVEKTLFLEAQERKYSLPSAQTSKEEQEAKNLVQAYTTATRGKTLLEEHQERAAREAKAVRDKEKAKKAKARKDKKEKGASEKNADPDDDGTGWNYKPWNRETDLEAGRIGTKALDPSEMLKKAGGDLKGRFGSSATEGGGR